MAALAAAVVLAACKTTTGRTFPPDITGFVFMVEGADTFRLANARVYITNDSTMTDSDGAYYFEDVAPGRVDVLAEAEWGGQTLSGSVSVTARVGDTSIADVDVGEDRRGTVRNIYLPRTSGPRKGPGEVRSSGVLP